MRRLAVSLLLILVPFVSTSALAAWPNGKDEDPRLSPPNDPGYGGQWNLWSHYPDAWAAKIKDPTERAMGPGISADRAWQVTTGDRKVIIAVHDSGADWGNRDLVNKWFLNAGELANCKPTPFVTPPADATEFDVDGSGWFDIRDYYATSNEAALLADWDMNHNGMLDPEDLIMKCSNGTDDDHNGYIDDISGWDFFLDDNDAKDDTEFGHGNGEARDSSAEGNNGIGDIGVCPNCTVVMMRVGDSFVADVNNFAQGVVYSVDNGVSVVQSALGAVNYTQFARQAIDYAYANNVAVVTSAADELSYHHNFPGSGEHSLYVHAVQYDGNSPELSTTFMNFNNCTNFGMQLLLSTPGTGCSSEATGITSGHVGLIYSAALKVGLNPPLSADEVKQLLTMESDDIAINPLDNDSEKYVSKPGWDWHFGYGRNNARRTVDAVVEGRLPPEAYIDSPSWFEVLDPSRTPNVDIACRVNQRVDGKAARYATADWVMEYATGVAPEDSEFHEIDHGTTAGMNGKCATWDLTKVALDLDKKLDDPHQNAVTLRLRVTAKTSGGVTVHADHRKGVLLQKDPDLYAGFPIDLGTSAESSPIFADIDGKDHDEELVLFSSDGKVHVYQADGSELAGFPVKVGFRPAMDAAKPGNVRGSCAFRADKAGCPRQNGGVDPDVGRQTAMMPLAIGDLDKDGKLEIVVSTWDGQVFVYENDGSLRPGWPQGLDYAHVVGQTSPDRILEAGFFASPVLYDLDQQGGLEIVMAGMDQYIYVWHADGTTMAPYPVRLYNPDDPESVAGADRIVATPAIGDIDGDGKPEIACGSSEVYGAQGVENEATAYVLEAETGTIAPGWPQSLFGLTVAVLPTVGRGVVANPMLADLDFDGKLEVSFDTISTQGWIFRYDGKIYRKMNNQVFGAQSNSQDSPAYILMNNGGFGNIDGQGGIDMVKGTAGFDFALAFAGGGKKGLFDHHMSGWDTDTGKMMLGFPRVHDDWQFFNAPSIVDLTGDALPEVIIGSGGYLVHAWDYLGREPAGWPKQTGGWVIASAAVGDFDGDEKLDVGISTRDGWLFVWKTQGSVHNLFEWNGFSHDPMHTGNYENDPTPYQTWSDSPVVEPDPGPEPVAEAPVEVDSDTGSAAEAEAQVETTPAKKDSGCSTGDASGLALALVGLALVARRRYATSLNP
ncbi:MAG: S8 family serine peptidase [Myxococcota bacterium]